MRSDSRTALELGRLVFRAYGSDWSRVHSAGRMRPDGVIEMPAVEVRDNEAQGPAALQPAE